MAADQKAPPAGGGLTLYAHLVGATGASVPGQISSAPVMYDQSSKAQEQEKGAAAAKPSTDFTKQIFQQRKRPPTNKNNRGSKAPNFPIPTSSTAQGSSSPGKDNGAEGHAAPAIGPVTTTTAADWMSKEEDDLEYLEAEKSSRPGRRYNKKKKKNKHEWAADVDWDEPYDPSQPTNIELYQDSEEFRDAENEWFNKLHAHSKSARRASSSTEAEESSAYAQRNRMFAPPPEIKDPRPTEDVIMGDPTPHVADRDQSGDDVWARRAAMNGLQFHPPAEESSASATAPAPPSIPTLGLAQDPSGSLPAHSPPAQSTSTVISRAPVRFEAAVTAEDTQDDHEDGDRMVVDDDTAATAGSDQTEAPRSSRPGQAGFAKRLLMKHGWKEGEGLGASGTGMVKPLFVKLDKPKKFSDAEGGGYRKGGTGKIMGGKKAKGVVEDEGQFGKMSEVIVIMGLLDGVNVTAEMQADIPLFQRVGDECNTRFGNVEKVTANEETGRIFIKFTQGLSALRAVQALDGGTLEALDAINTSGSTALARYYDSDDYAKQIFDAPIKGV